MAEADGEVLMEATAHPSVVCSRDAAWLKSVGAILLAKGVEFHIVVFGEVGTELSVLIYLRGSDLPLADIQLRQLAC